jgi:hypothetical protein
MRLIDIVVLFCLSVGRILRIIQVVGLLGLLLYREEHVLGFSTTRNVAECELARCSMGNHGWDYIK